MADLFIAPAPRCPVHGQMHEHFVHLAVWVCHGWDGEGCDHLVRAEDVQWQHIGETDGPVSLSWNGTGDAG